MFYHLLCSQVACPHCAKEFGSRRDLTVHLTRGWGCTMDLEAAMDGWGEEATMEQDQEASTMARDTYNQITSKDDAMFTTMLQKWQA